MTRCERMMRLHLLLMPARVPIGREDVTQRLGVSRATLAHDIAFSRDGLRAPPKFDRDNKGYGLSAKGPDGRHYHLHEVWLREHEARAIVLLAHLVD